MIGTLITVELSYLVYFVTTDKLHNFTAHIVKLCTLYLAGRGVLTPYSMKKPPILPIFPFQFFSNPLAFPCRLQPLTQMFFLFPCFFGWMDDHTTILLNDIMDLLMSRYGTLVPEGPRCVFYVTRCQVNWGLTHVAF